MRIVILFTLSLLLAACSESGNTNAALAAPHTVDESPIVAADKTISAADTATTNIQAPLPPPPPPSEKRKANEEKETLKSVFLNLGCCEKEAERTADCCCLGVLGKYRELVKNKDAKLGHYKMNDPILGNCRRKMAKEFELIDYPKVEEEEEDQDLF